MQLRVDWASHRAAAWACKHWHYSRTIPAGKLVKIGVWEAQQFVGVVIFGRGANNNLGKPYGLQQTECCELVRIALTRGHTAPVSRVVRLALIFLRKQSPGLRLIVSYADPEQGHVGGIYQAGNWLYVGRSQAQCEVMHNGKLMHKRTANALFGTIKGMPKSKELWKHKYLYPLDGTLREHLQSKAQPYPKRSKQAMAPTKGNSDVAATIRPPQTLSGPHNAEPAEADLSETVEREPG